MGKCRGFFFFKKKFASFPALVVACSFTGVGVKLYGDQLLSYGAKKTTNIECL